MKKFTLEQWHEIVAIVGEKLKAPEMKLRDFNYRLDAIAEYYCITFRKPSWQ
jgi:hypothetical protein